MSYLPVTDNRLGLFDPAAMKDVGLERREQYQSADPFPHIAIDDFLPTELLDYVLSQFPQAPDPESREFDRNQERFKTSYNPDYLTPDLRAFFYSLNSRPFLKFLENMTGIMGLIPDPYFIGGGFHETRTGGHLDVHTDFNLHKPLRLERRLNALIYLNRDWKLDYGGGLELWDEKMERCVRAIEPAFGRCVVFSTDDTSYHGHPTPVNHPEGRSRRSIALYYYTATWDDSRSSKTTQFKVRPGTKDEKDWRVKRTMLIREFLPPVIARPVLRAISRVDAPKA